MLSNVSLQSTFKLPLYERCYTDEADSLYNKSSILNQRFSFPSTGTMFAFNSCTYRSSSLETSP